MLGETNPQMSEPGTIRGDYCIDVGRNIIHASDSVNAAKKEIQMWFGDAVSQWKKCDLAWVYEDEADEEELEANIKKSVCIRSNSTRQF